MMKRVKSLFIAASIVAIVIGGVQILGNLFSAEPTPPKPSAGVSRPDNQTAEDAAERPVVAAKPPAPPTMPGLAPADSPNVLPPPISQTMPPTPSLLSPPALNLTPSQTQQSDVTGSIPNGRPVQRAVPAAQPSDRLPIAIGSAKLRDAAALGDAAAAYEIASRFLEGRGVPVSYEEAARWYERAAGKGLALAQFRYATLLEKGQGVKKDTAHARRLYTAAANQGNAKAMHNLAVLYAEGIDGRPDYTTAAQWFRKAALRGVPDSQYNLGVLCARGLGTEKSLIESYKWFALAGAQGDKEAVRKRDEVASQLEADELKAAQHAAKTFVAEAQPHAATAVPLPPGGWEEGEAPAPGKARAAKPLALGTFNVGKR
jgi:localization factor PodJL